MSEYRISQLAERTGFPASTLRYYEQAGLLPEAPRTPGGYRSYDDRAVERLRLVARAKHLGLPLAEIRELAGIWDTGSCAGVQRRLTALLATRIADVDRQIGELTAFGCHLAAARSALATTPAAGPCTDTCGCLEPAAGAAGAAGTTAAAVACDDGCCSPGAAPEGAVPVLCTLDSGDQTVRAAEWDDVLSGATDRQSIVDGVRMVFPPDAELAGRLAALCVREQQCCAFFRFTIEVAAGAVTPDVRAPAEAGEIVHALFGLGT